MLGFEPDLTPIRQLRWKVAANGAEDRILVVVEADVGATPGTGSRLLGRHKSGENRLAEDGDSGALSVRVATLAAAVQKAELERIDYLKVDAMGGEADVLKPLLATAPSPSSSSRTLIVKLGWAPPRTTTWSAPPS